MFRKHSKVISVILSLTLIATMCVMSATSFSAADTGFYVVGEMQGWAPATADPMTDNGDGTWTKVYTNLPVGAGGFKVIDAQSSDWDSFNQYNQDGNANFGKPDVKYEITEANSTMTIVFSETEMKVLSWEITAGEQPTGGSEATRPVGAAVCNGRYRGFYCPCGRHGYNQRRRIQDRATRSFTRLI